MTNNSQFTIDRTRRGRWTVTFSNPPINMFVPETIDELRELMTDIEADPSVKVVVFQSADPEFSSPISTYPRQPSNQTCWTVGVTLCCASHWRLS